MELDNEEDMPRIGNRSDALDLLDVMIEKMEAIDTEGPRSIKGLGYFRPRLKALKDAIEREII
ncbi:hypothetical protein [Leadbettera azotonutricia]|uniref:Uncharacterized protein n=1 Tax=Leadbettera azotonutricia (strain ATCC BAA-888 / DSM 13862 / ZAS-9) TaxID=545695 RepID=F5YBH5_LEAAZ|nr:hypothetical protein [Leadbettera azotonutricia]AEF81301.1 hypothetical protein TREAZ_0610 [Leadbettera azotonutricia ZAS-9]